MGWVKEQAGSRSQASEDESSREGNRRADGSQTAAGKPEVRGRAGDTLRGAWGLWRQPGALVCHAGLRGLSAGGPSSQVKPGGLQTGHGPPLSRLATGTSQSPTLGKEEEPVAQFQEDCFTAEKEATSVPKRGSEET